MELRYEQVSLCRPANAVPAGKYPSAFEGETQEQQNPFSRDNPAWAAWIIARLGGWKGCSIQRPPGIIILHDGWVKFQSVFEGWQIAKIVYKR